MFPLSECLSTSQVLKSRRIVLRGLVVDVCGRAGWEWLEGRFGSRSRYLRKRTNKGLFLWWRLILKSDGEKCDAKTLLRKCMSVI
jgi:hypothetical protein